MRFGRRLLLSMQQTVRVVSAPAASSVGRASYSSSISCSSRIITNSAILPVRQLHSSPLPANRDSVALTGAAAPPVTEDADGEGGIAGLEGTDLAMYHTELKRLGVSNATCLQHLKAEDLIQVRLRPRPTCHRASMLPRVHALACPTPLHLSAHVHSSMMACARHVPARCECGVFFRTLLLGSQYICVQ